MNNQPAIPIPSVLVVDDNDWNRDLLLIQLGGLGVRLEGACNGAEALAKARENPPAVIVSDWMMPEMDGLELCKAIRAESALAHTHFLIITARNEAQDLVKAFDCGADDFLTKPVNHSELLARVRVGLRLQRLYFEVDAARWQALSDADKLRQAQERLRQALGKLDDQIHEIAELQTSFLPSRFPSVGGLNFAAFCKPSSDVGGDYYDVFTLPDGRVFFLIADVTGHGARAAVCMAMTRSLVRAAATLALPQDGPGPLLAHANTWLSEQLTPGQFVTMWAGLWDPVSTEIRYVRAGHPHGILWRPGEAPAVIASNGVPPLGLLGEEIHMEEERLRLEVGERVVLYTDGWTESANAAQQMLGADGFLRILNDMEGLSLESVPLGLYMQLERFVANAAITDDVSLLVLERTA